LIECAVLAIFGYDEAKKLLNENYQDHTPGFMRSKRAIYWGLFATFLPVNIALSVPAVLAGKNRRGETVIGPLWRGYVVVMDFFAGLIAKLFHKPVESKSFNSILLPAKAAPIKSQEEVVVKGVPIEEPAEIQYCSPYLRVGSTEGVMQDASDLPQAEAQGPIGYPNARPSDVVMVVNARGQSVSTVPDALLIVGSSNQAQIPSSSAQWVRG
jgi:hypothetical protein